MIKLVKAFYIAIRAHKGQVDKGGKPYIFHPIRVASDVKSYEAKVVALLHDVLEDSDKYTLEEFTFLNDTQKEALILLTHNHKVKYFDYISAINKNKIAREVKLSDLRQNSNLNRLKTITDSDLKRVQKYRKAISLLS